MPPPGSKSIVRTFGRQSGIVKGDDESKGTQRGNVTSSTNTLDRERKNRFSVEKGKGRKGFRDSEKSESESDVDSVVAEGWKREMETSKPKKLGNEDDDNPPHFKGRFSSGLNTGDEQKGRRKKKEEEPSQDNDFDVVMKMMSALWMNHEEAMKKEMEMFRTEMVNAFKPTNDTMRQIGDMIPLLESKLSLQEGSIQKKGKRKEKNSSGDFFLSDFLSGIDSTIGDKTYVITKSFDDQEVEENLKKMLGEEESKKLKDIRIMNSFTQLVN